MKGFRNIDTQTVDVKADCSIDGIQEASDSKDGHPRPTILTWGLYPEKKQIHCSFDK